MSTRRDKDRLDAWITRPQPGPEACYYCERDIWLQVSDEGKTAWVDDTDGDCCPGGDDGNGLINEGEPHISVNDFDWDARDYVPPAPCERCGQVGLHQAECPDRDFPWNVRAMNFAGDSPFSWQQRGQFSVVVKSTERSMLSCLVDNAECAEAMRTLVLYAQTADSLSRMAHTIQTLAVRLAHWEGTQDKADPQ